MKDFDSLGTHRDFRLLGRFVPLRQDRDSSDYRLVAISTTGTASADDDPDHEQPGHFTVVASLYGIDRPSFAEHYADGSDETVAAVLATRAQQEAERRINAAEWYHGKTYDVTVRR